MTPMTLTQQQLRLLITSLSDYQHFLFLIVIPSLVLCPLFRFLQGYGFELLLVCPDPRGSSRPHFQLYPRVAEVMPTARVRATTLSHN